MSVCILVQSVSPGPGKFENDQKLFWFNLSISWSHLLLQMVLRRQLSIFRIWSQNSRNSTRIQGLLLAINLPCPLKWSDALCITTTTWAKNQVCSALDMALHFQHFQISLWPLEIIGHFETPDLVCFSKNRPFSSKNQMFHNKIN